MSTPDITVLGAGIFGLSVAWACLCRGAKVQVIDPGGVAAGASGGIVGALAPHTPEKWNEKKAFQLKSLLMADAYWAKVAETSGRDPGYARIGRLQPIPDQRGLDLARRRAGAAKTLWQGRADWRVTRIPPDPQFAPQSPIGWYINDTLSARIHPRRACRALAAAIISKGGIIRTDGAPKGRLVEATGYRGLEALSAALDRPLGNGVKGQAALLRYDAQDAPQIFAETLHFVPHADGTLAIGSTSERAFADPSATDEALDDLVARARAVLPVLTDAGVIDRWAGVRPRAKSRAPMLGRHPAKTGAFIANGGFKIGFGMAPAIGEVMADLILEDRDNIPQTFSVEASL